MTQTKTFRLRISETVYSYIYVDVSAKNEQEAIEQAENEMENKYYDLLAESTKCDCEHEIEVVE